MKLIDKNAVKYKNTLHQKPKVSLRVFYPVYCKLFYYEEQHF